MSPETPLFGRLTVGGNRASLGRGGLTTLLIRATEQLRKLRPADDTVIQIEMCRNQLPDASTFDKLARVEQQFAERIQSHPKMLSPFPGILNERVTQVMATPEYEAYSQICEPVKRMSLTPHEITVITLAYKAVADDCFEHFPKWID